MSMPLSITAPVKDPHPCFEEKAKGSCGRIHLPVAPKCNILCNFCRRDFDCVNESRPGVTSKVLTPSQALDYLGRALDQEPRLTVAGIAGPGDPMANPVETLATLKGIRRQFPHLLICLASNGLAVPDYLDDLAEVGLTHMTLTVNAVDPEIGSRIYRWVKFGKVHYRGRDAAALLWDRQQEAIKGLKQRGVKIKINTIIIPGVNDEHAVEVAKTMGEMGVFVQNCIPLLPVAGTPLADTPQMPQKEVKALRKKTGVHVPQMTHCQRCRADAVGLLENDQIKTLGKLMFEAPGRDPGDLSRRPHVAVASMEGLLVNQHLGEAIALQIWTQTEEGFRLMENRDVPEPGGGTSRWESLARIISDCRAVLASSLGPSPEQVLKAHGIRPVIMEGFIEEGLEAIYSGRDLSRFKKRSPRQKTKFCCSGGGSGC